MNKIKQFELDPSIEYIKIHGLQRTATNYFSYIVDQNFKNCKSLVNIGGWKHGHYCAPWSLGREVHILVVVKNPYSWLVSFYRYLNPPFDFETFLKTPIIVGEPNGTPYFLRAENPVQHWNNMNFHWISIRMNLKKVCTVPFESIILSPEEMIPAIGKYFNLQVKDNLVISKKQMKPANEIPEVSEKDFDKDFYLQKKYLENFNSSSIDFTNQQLDENIMQKLSYELEKI
jgi:hypothetical protein